MIIVGIFTYQIDAPRRINQNPGIIGLKNLSLDIFSENLFFSWAICLEI